MNKVILLGRLGKDAETKNTQGGKLMVKFTLATSDGRKGLDGKEITQWHSCTSFSESTAKIAQYLVKGKQIALEGRIEYRKHEEKYFTDIIVDRVEFVGSKNDSAQGTVDRQNANAFAPRRRTPARDAYDHGDHDWSEGNPREDASHDADEDQIPF